MSNWSISGKGSFADLGLSNLKCTFTNQDIDQCTFTATGAAIDSSPILSYGANVSISKDGGTWFSGRVNRIRPFGSLGEESIVYELVGPWWWLEKITYQQIWQCFNIGLATLADTWKSRVILFQDEEGDAIHSGLQIIDVINFAISKGAPIALGTIDADLPLPMDEQRELSCADVIRRICKFQPDLVCYFDYSFNPPKFNCRKSANLSALSFSLGPPISEIRTNPRHDLVLPGVVIRYEITGDNNGTNYEQVVIDTAGNTENVETLVATLDLAGSRMSWVEQTVKTVAYPVEPTTAKKFWKDRIAWLTAIPDADLVIHAVTRESELPRILIEGDIAEWIVDEHDVSWQEDTLTIDFSYVLRNGNKAKIVTGAMQSVKVIATDILSGTQTFRKRGSTTTESGEPVPDGLAAKLYSSWSQLHYEGEITLVNEEVSNYTLGKKINVLGGSGLLQRVEHNVDSGESVLTFGPPTHLGLDELLELFRALRSRRSAVGSTSRISGLVDDQALRVPVGGVNILPLPGGPGGGQAEKFVTDPDSSSSKMINLDPAEITPTKATPSPVEIKARELDVCVDGVPMKIQVLCSAPYEVT